MASGNFDGTSFDGSIGGFDVDASSDTHDGHSGRKRIHDVPGFDEPRHNEPARRKELLRQAIEFAMYGPQIEESQELAAAAKPFAERLESGRVQLDWAKIEENAVARVELMRMAEDLERRVREFEEDEEDVSFLLLH